MTPFGGSSYDHGFGIPSIEEALRNAYGETAVQPGPPPNPMPSATQGSVSEEVAERGKKFSRIANLGRPFAHFDDSLGRAVRSLFGAMSQEVPDVQSGTRSGCHNMNAQRLANFANACGDFEACDDEVGEAIRELYAVCDRILMPSR